MLQHSVESYGYRILSPIDTAWSAIPRALVENYPHQMIGELPSVYRASVWVTGWRTFTVIIGLTEETSTSTVLTVQFNVLAYSILVPRASVRREQADRIYETVVSLLTRCPG